MKQGNATGAHFVLDSQGFYRECVGNRFTAQVPRDSAPQGG